jgi:hypothetical protein
MSNNINNNQSNIFYYGSDQQSSLNDQIYFNLRNSSIPEYHLNNSSIISSNSTSYDQNLLTSSTFNNLLSSVNEELSNSMTTSSQINNSNTMRRRSTGCFINSSKLVLPTLQTLQESSSFTNSLNSISNQFQIAQNEYQDQFWSPLQRSARCTSFSTPLNPMINEGAPINLLKQRRRLSASSIGTSSTSSPGNIWERVLYQNYLNNTSIRNNTRNLLSLIDNNISTSSSSGLRSELDESNKSFEENIAISGNMFHKRDGWSVLERIPAPKQNTIHIRLEDEGPFGNDEIRCYVLSHFSSLGIRELKCVFCNDELKIYDRFPLIDGTLFLSPYAYDKEKAIKAGIANKDQFIYAVCLKCLNGLNNIKCKWCNKIWNSESLQIGTLYKYDIFAAFPCCQKRLCCNKCNEPLVDINDQCGLPYFSSYSQEIECQNCKFKSHHFIKPLDSTYTT